jgi:hypothetical protein
MANTDVEVPFRTIAYSFRARIRSAFSGLSPQARIFGTIQLERRRGVRASRRDASSRTSLPSL